MLRVRARLPDPIRLPDIFAIAVPGVTRQHESGSPSFSMRPGNAPVAPSNAGSRNQTPSVSPESTLLRGSRLFCVTTVSIVCTIKAPVPVRAEDSLDPPYLHGR